MYLLITGATGHIGSQIAYECNKKNLVSPSMCECLAKEMSKGRNNWEAASLCVSLSEDY